MIVPASWWDRQEDMPQHGRTRSLGATRRAVDDGLYAPKPTMASKYDRHEGPVLTDRFREPYPASADPKDYRSGEPPAESATVAYMRKYGLVEESSEPQPYSGSSRRTFTETSGYDTRRQREDRVVDAMPHSRPLQRQRSIPASPPRSGYSTEDRNGTNSSFLRNDGRQGYHSTRNALEPDREHRENRPAASDWPEARDSRDRDLQSDLRPYLGLDSRASKSRSDLQPRMPSRQEDYTRVLDLDRLERLPKLPNVEQGTAGSEYGDRRTGAARDRDRARDVERLRDRARGMDVGSRAVQRM
jgi:hypothetical protein